MKRGRRAVTKAERSVTLGKQQNLGIAWLNFEVFKCHRECNLNLKVYSLSS